MRKDSQFEDRWVCALFWFPFLLPSHITSFETNRNHRESHQVQALIAFKQSSVAADPNGFLDDWTRTASNPCSWRGISCSPAGQVNALNLTNAGLVGNLRIDDLTSLESLQHLYFSGNSFSADIFLNKSSSSCIFVTVDLSFNALYGTEIHRSLTNCRMLEKLDLSYNKLQGKISDEFKSFKKTRHLTLAHNNFSGEIPPELGFICGMLQSLDLSGNKLSGGLPETFTSCNSLQSLNLGDNQLSKNFLTRITSTFPNLNILQIQFNNITGPIPQSITNLTQLQVLDLSSNAFTGSIPSGFCSSSSLQKLLLSGNSLSGSIPSSLGNCKNLSIIDLSLNNLSGPIPLEIWMLPKLTDLIIWGNNIAGEIPKGICYNGSNLERLILNNNLFTGTIPKSLTNCTKLTMLSLSHNQLIGEIPSSIQKLRNLNILQLSHNSLTGKIPAELGNCENLLWLDLSNNKLSSTIPTELANPKTVFLKFTNNGKKQAAQENNGGQDCRIAIKLLYSKGIREENLVRLSMDACSRISFFSASIVHIPAVEGSLVYLDLSSNSFSGSIPNALGSMRFLSFLSLGNNSLTGTIPDMFGNLLGLGVLDLSHNHLHGGIPGSLASLPALNDVDLSNNNLSGPIPQTKQIWQFHASRFENNSRLCGHPLPDCEDPRSHSEAEELKGFWYWFVVLMGFAAGSAYGKLAADIVYVRVDDWFRDTISLIKERNRRNLSEEDIDMEAENVDTNPNQRNNDKIVLSHSK